MSKITTLTGKLYTRCCSTCCATQFLSCFWQICFKRTIFALNFSGFSGYKICTQNCSSFMANTAHPLLSQTKRRKRTPRGVVIFGMPFEAWWFGQRLSWLTSLAIQHFPHFTLDVWFTTYMLNIVGMASGFSQFIPKWSPILAGSSTFLGGFFFWWSTICFASLEWNPSV